MELIYRARYANSCKWRESANTSFLTDDRSRAGEIFVIESQIRMPTDNISKNKSFIYVILLHIDLS